MSLNYYKLYVNQVLDLSKTMVIKVEAVADSINERLKATYGNVFDVDDKRTWKYYLNLSGQYHSTDKKIYVTSLDTLQTIEFSRDTLAIHRATAKAYEYGTRYYRELLSQYPEYEQFILGALYPVNIEQAINAEDFTVIGYPINLIEDNEVSLIDNINKWLYGFKERWYNRQFNLTDTNYISAFLAVMFLQLPPLIISLRLRSCKTPEAHSFHVREYLESHGMLDVYLSNMTRKQALFFYRNINYIERNSGKRETFEWLIEKVMTDRNLPISEFNMHHDITSMPEASTPKAMFRKRLLNEEARIFEHDAGIYNLAYILSKEEPEAVGNSEYRTIHEKDIENKFQRSITNRYKTKILESAMFDYSDSMAITQADIALNNWIYLSQKNKYTSYIPVTNPVSGATTTVDVKVGLILFLYAYCKAHGLNVKTIPPLVATRVPIDPVPTRDEIYSIVDKNYVPIEYIDFILDLHKPHETIISTPAFTEWVLAHHEAAIKQTYFISNHEHMYTRGLVHNAVSRLYQVAVVENEFTGKDFESILKFNNIDIEGLGTNDWIRLYTEIYKEATGFDMNATSVTSDLQKAMVSLLRQLSSYSIQFVQSINKSSIKVLNWAAIRLGDVKYTGRALYEVQLALMRVFKLVIKNYPKFEFELPDILQNFTLRSDLEVEFIDIPVNIMGDVKISNKKIVDLGMFKLNQHIGPYCAGSNLFEIPLFKPYYDLSPEEKKKVKDIYTNYPTPDDYIPNVDVETIAKSLKIGVDNIKPRLNIMDSYVNFYVSKTYEAFYNDDIKVILDGFYNNIEDTFVINHQVFKGYYKAESFKYMSQIPEETNWKGEEYTGGILLGPLYSIKKTGDIDLELKPITTVYEDGSIVFEPQYLNFDIAMHWYNYAHAEFSIQYRPLESILKAMKVVTHDLDAGTLLSPGGDRELDVKPTYIRFTMPRVPTPYNPLGGYTYLVMDYEVSQTTTMNTGTFSMNPMVFRYGNGTFATKLGIGHVEIANVRLTRFEYNVSQTFGTQFLEKTLANKNGISHRTIPKMIFRYINTDLDITNWRL